MALSSFSRREFEMPGEDCLAAQTFAAALRHKARDGVTIQVV